MLREILNRFHTVEGKTLVKIKVWAPSSFEMCSQVSKVLAVCDSYQSSINILPKKLMAEPCGRLKSNVS